MRGWAFLLLALAHFAAGTCSGATAPADLDVAKHWLAAAAKASGSTFESSMGLPFTYRTTNKVKKCEGAVRDAPALSKWASCFRKDQKLLLDEIRAGAQLQAASPHDAGPNELRAIAKQIPGDGTAFTFLFKLTGADGRTKVAAVVLEEEVERG